MNIPEKGGDFLSTLKKTATSLFSSVMFLFVLTTSASAKAEKAEGFVCPAISTDAVLNSPKGGVISGGDYTIGGPDVMVPVRATNADGESSPGGTHSGPGDTDYTTVWSR